MWRCLGNEGCELVIQPCECHALLRGVARHVSVAQQILSPASAPTTSLDLQTHDNERFDKFSCAS